VPSTTMPSFTPQPKLKYAEGHSGCFWRIPMMSRIAALCLTLSSLSSFAQEPDQKCAASCAQTVMSCMNPCMPSKVPSKDDKVGQKNAIACAMKCGKVQEQCIKACEAKK
jgi:hypothetical protein